jgi:hypothetical protein
MTSVPEIPSSLFGKHLNTTAGRLFPLHKEKYETMPCAPPSFFFSVLTSSFSSSLHGTVPKTPTGPEATLEELEDSLSTPMDLSEFIFHFLFLFLHPTLSLQRN